MTILKHSFFDLPIQSSHGHTMKQFMDIFSLPEMTLLSCVNDYFMKHNIDYEPVHLYKDVKVQLLYQKWTQFPPVESRFPSPVSVSKETKRVPLYLEISRAHISDKYGS